MSRHAVSPAIPSDAEATRFPAILPPVWGVQGRCVRHPRFLDGDERALLRRSALPRYDAHWDRARFLERYPVQQVGDDVHRELWVPAEELAEFNLHIVGLIEVVEEFRA